MPMFTLPGGKRVWIGANKPDFAEPGDGGLTSKITWLRIQGVTVLEVEGTTDTVGAELDRQPALEMALTQAGEDN